MAAVVRGVVPSIRGHWNDDRRDFESTMGGSGPASARQDFCGTV